MTVEYVPLLSIQKEIYALPRDFGRFQTYLKTILSEAGDAVVHAPLVAMNPMGKEHCAAHVDALLALDAESVAARALQEAIAELPISIDTSLALKAGLVVCDDVGGGWTNRTASEYRACIDDGEDRTKRPWLSIRFWTSEPPTIEGVSEAARTALRRAAYQRRHGGAKTLVEVLLQERFCAMDTPPLLADEFARVGNLLRPLLETPSENMPVIVAALFGDDAAASLGYAPLGFRDEETLRWAKNVQNMMTPSALLQEARVQSDLEASKP